jgi:hypothetical protein
MIIMAPLLVWLMSLAPGGGSLRLQYGWQPDAAYEQTMTMSSSVRLDVLGTTEGEAAPQTLSRDLKYDVALTLVFDTGQRSDDGSLPFECRLLKARGGTTKDGNAIEAAGMKKLEGQKIAHGRLLPAGRSIELEMEQMEGSAALPPDFKDRLLQSLPALPEGALKVGESFEVPLGMTLPVLPMIGKLTITSKATYTLKEISRREARFEVTQTLSSVGSGQQVGAGGPAAGFTGGASGVATFDRAQGLFSAMHMEMLVEMSQHLTSMAQGPGPGAAAGGSGQTQPRASVVQVKAKVQGPIDFTMTRAQRASD